MKNKKGKIDYRKYWNEEMTTKAKEYWMKCGEQYEKEFNGLSESLHININI